MKIRLDPYKPRSKSGRAMAQRLGVLRTTQRQIAKHGTFDYIINWGSTERRFPNARYINDPDAVAHACDKKASLSIFTQAGVPCPDWTTDKGVAQTWLESGHTVVSRLLLRANSGRGIVLVDSGGGEEIPDAPLYTKYVKKADEYRVHVFRGTVIDVAQKKKRQEVANERVNYQVRAARNGWVFCRDGVIAPDCVRDAAVMAVSALGLDFGAVDVGYNQKRGEATVFEANTAPGVEGTTLTRYFNAFYYAIPQLQGGRHATRRRHYA